MHVPVAIVGGGACGLVCALRLQALGVEALVIERDDSPSGSTALSSGFIPAAGTRAQIAAGIVDTVADFEQDIRQKAGGLAAPHLVRAYARAAGPALDWLAAAHGFEFEVLGGFLYPGHRVRRMHSLPARTGEALMSRLLQAAGKAGVMILGASKVESPDLDAQNMLIGLQYRTKTFHSEHLLCDAVMLACNGFGGDSNLVAINLPEMANAYFAGHTGNDGSALSWGKALGADTADLSGYQGHGSWAIPQGALISWALMMEGGIQVNLRGERFHDETKGYSEAAVQVLAQPDGVAWNIVDERLLTLARTFPDFVEAEKAGAVKPLNGFAQPFQQAVRSTCTHAHSVSKRLLTQPLYAIKVTGALFHTQGGLAIDAHCRVLRNGQTIPKLWAAGGAARGVSGPRVEGYLSGNGLLSAVAGGWIAAESIANVLQSHTLP